MGVPSGAAGSAARLSRQRIEARADPWVVSGQGSAERPSRQRIETPPRWRCRSLKHRHFRCTPLATANRRQGSADESMTVPGVEVRLHGVPALVHDLQVDPLVASPAMVADTHVTKRPPRRCASEGRVPISGQPTPPDPATTPPGSSTTGAVSHTGPGDQHPRLGVTNKVTGRPGGRLADLLDTEFARVSLVAVPGVGCALGCRRTRAPGDATRGVSTTVECWAGGAGRNLGHGGCVIVPCCRLGLKAGCRCRCL